MICCYKRVINPKIIPFSGDIMADYNPKEAVENLDVNLKLYNFYYGLFDEDVENKDAYARDFLDEQYPKVKESLDDIISEVKSAYNRAKPKVPSKRSAQWDTSKMHSPLDGIYLMQPYYYFAKNALECAIFGAEIPSLYNGNEELESFFQKVRETYKEGMKK
jgi:hypothetical protein